MENESREDVDSMKVWHSLSVKCLEFFDDIKDAMVEIESREDVDYTEIGYSLSVICKMKLYTSEKEMVLELLKPIEDVILGFFVALIEHFSLREEEGSCDMPNTEDNEAPHLALTEEEWSCGMPNTGEKRAFDMPITGEKRAFDMPITEDNADVDCCLKRRKIK